MEDDNTLVGALFLFTVMFFITKWSANNLRETHKRLPGSDNMPVSRRIFEIREVNVFEYIMNSIGLIMTIIMQAKMVYKFLKTYRKIKYIISMTRIISRITGWFCACYVPYPMRYVIYGGFAKFYGLDMSEVQEPDFGAYETFTKFFIRELKAGVRPVYEPKNNKSMCSPADGKVLTCGIINSEYSTIDCVKGRSYRLDEFMLGCKGNSMSNDQTEVTENNGEVAAMIDKVK
jgi:hypothetical protein